jgi:hypothetical protein
VEKLSNILFRLELELDFVVARDANVEFLVAIHFERSLSGTAKSKIEIYWLRLQTNWLDPLPLHENCCSAAMAVPPNVISK